VGFTRLKRTPSLIDKCLDSHLRSIPDFGIALNERAVRSVSVCVQSLSETTAVSMFMCESG
jgi:hypothetical protein